ncbi:mandelate racemase/muconate lactonizing enzyme family protein [Actibacterium sp. MT2.3-13A]|uniref:mandelate racemase/muconate lactonizing enzyme family protein n=1 Tax=Actibacterium sp. MT2.3-13A TaxID=2828332 RepID=UPI001BA5E638|nr:mandelate racemase/muconate lactonizing enzyme family protein [Actibacterium sp. MT2.3-13A]
MGLATSRQTGLIFVELADGTVGLGEAWGPPGVSAAYLDLIRPYFIGCSVFAFEHAVDLVLSRHYHFGIQNQMMSVISGIDVAARDAAAKRLGVPLYDLIGGARELEVPIYASGGYITAAPEADFEAQMAQIAGGGFSSVKIKIGMSPASDEWRVTKAREVLGDDVELLVDTNSNYTVDVALESMRRIEKYRIGWYEEPLSPLDFEGYAELCRRAPIPVATGEALYTAHDFKRLADIRGAHILQPDLSLCGGLGQGRRIADIARLSHMRLSPHVWGSAVGLAAACHFVASLSGYPHAGHCPKPSLLEYDVGENPLRDELLKTPIVRKGNKVLVPEGPGLGIELDEAALARFAQ